MSIQTGQKESMPSTQIAECISSFLSCLDKAHDNVVEGSKEADGEEDTVENISMKLPSKTKNCYQLFQDCSGSVILIPDLYNDTGAPNEDAHIKDVKNGGNT